MQEYGITLTHEYHDSINELTWFLQIKDESEISWSINSKWELIENFKLIGQITRCRVWTLLAFTKIHKDNETPKIIYWGKKHWLEKDLSWIYNWFWYNLHRWLFMPAEDFKTKSVWIIAKIPDHSLQHKAHIKLSRSN